jgi:ATP-dependent exoDNAse (exonuclease V) alpha subunit
MSADELQSALETLESARDLADGEAEDRLDRIAGKVSKALDADRQLDHGALARMDRTLAELGEDATGETAEAIETAKQALITYREGVPGA